MAWYDDLNAGAGIGAAPQAGSVGLIRQMRSQEDQKRKLAEKNKPKGNFLSSLLPTGGGIGGALAGGAGGAAIGSVVPGIGTAIGGLLGAILGGAGGSALGKVGENAAEGEADLSKGVLGEAALGGLTSTPITAGFKLLKGGAALGKAVATGTGKEVAKKSFQEAGQLSIPKMAKGLQAKAGAEVGQTSALLPRVGGKMSPLDQARMESLGIKIGDKGITPDVAQKLLGFTDNAAVKYGGIRAGKPVNQALDAQAIHNNVIKSLDTELGKIDRAITPDEVSAVVSNAAKSVAENAAVTGSAKTLGKFTEKLTNAKTVKDLEKIRKEADDLAYTTTGAGKTAAAAQANAVREAIDGFVTELSPTYKAVKGDYTLSKQLLDATSKASKASKGVELPVKGGILGNVAVGGNTAVGAKNASLGLLRKLRGKNEPVISAENADVFGPPRIGQGVLGTVARESLLTQRPGIGTPPEATPEEVQFTSGGLKPGDLGYEEALANDNGGSILDSPAGSGSPFSAENVDATIASLIQQGADQKDIAAYLANVKAISDLKGGGKSTSKGLSATAADAIANAQSALSSIDTIESELSLDPSVQGRSAASAVANPFGITSRLAGTGKYDAALTNAKDVIARLRTGAAISNSEEKRFTAMLPQPADAPEVVQQKLSLLKNALGLIVQRVGNNGSDSLIQAAQDAQ